MASPVLRRLSRAAVAAFSLAVLSFFGLAFYSTINDTPLRKADVIVVLGARANEDGTLPPVLQSRIARGVELWKEGYAPKMLVTGGAVANTQIEAMAMARWAVEQGVPESSIIVEPRARSTRDNAKLSAAIVRKQNIGEHVILVTSAYHTRRAVGLFKAQDLDVQSVAVAYPDESGITDKIGYLNHEMGGMLLR